jgi:ABC-2 type transport system permease protein
MDSLADMIWVEWRKAVRSRMPYWTALGSLFMPLAVAFLIFVARNPEISQQLSLVGAKANLMQFAATDWQTYLGLFGQVFALVGLLLFGLVISWVFGREFADGTVKDLLAVPVRRSSILLGKFVVVAVWSAGLAAVMLIAALAMGMLIQLPGSSADVIRQGTAIAAIAACLTIVAALPLAFFASAGRGYLLPIGVALLILMATNVAVLIGRGEYFPWAVPGLYAQQTSSLAPISYLLVLLTGLAGMAGTYAWWKSADQNR